MAEDAVVKIIFEHDGSTRRVISVDGGNGRGQPRKGSSLHLRYGLIQDVPQVGHLRDTLGENVQIAVQLEGPVHLLLASSKRRHLRDCHLRHLPSELLVIVSDVGCHLVGVVLLKVNLIKFGAWSFNGLIERSTFEGAFGGRFRHQLGQV